ncbi:MAG: hypothetical protein ACREQ4_00340, partial [Candidatus Binataceae bacterium]
AEAPSQINNSNIMKPSAVSGAIAPTLNSAALQAAKVSASGGSMNASLSSGTYPSMMRPLASGQADQHAQKAELEAMLSRLTPRDRHKFKIASSRFPSFCRDWQRKLRAREVNNLSHLKFQERDGWESATYVGYGPVQTCLCKESREGIPIGKVTYQEFSYYLAGKTVDQAEHATPRIIGTTNTLEIFSWDKNRWFY